MSILNTAKISIEQGLLTSAIVGAGMYTVLNIPLQESISTPIGSVNTYLAVCGSAFVSDAIGRMLEDKVLDYITSNPQLKQLEQFVLPVLVGGTLYAVLALANGGGNYKIVLLGGGASMVADYIQKSIPYM